MRHRLGIVFALLCVLASNPVFAAKSKVKGKIVTSAGDGIKNAAVLLRNPEVGREYKMKSKKSGSFSKRKVEVGTYELVVSHKDYVRYRQQGVEVVEGEELELAVSLRHRDEEVVDEAEANLATAPKDPYRRGYDAFQAGEFAAVLAFADETMVKSPGDPRGYDIKAKALIRLNRYSEAIPLLETELTLDGGAEDVARVLAATNFNAGVAAARDQDTDGAIRYWERALELGFEEPLLDGALGRAYLQRSEFAVSKRYFESYLQQTPGASDAIEVRDLLSAIQKLEENN